MTIPLTIWRCYHGHTPTRRDLIQDHVINEVILIVQSQQDNIISTHDLVSESSASNSLTKKKSTKKKSTISLMRYVFKYFSSLVFLNITILVYFLFPRILFQKEKSCGRDRPWNTIFLFIHINTLLIRSLSSSWRKKMTGSKCWKPKCRNHSSVGRTQKFHGNLKLKLDYL